MCEDGRCRRAVAAGGYGVTGLTVEGGKDRGFEVYSRSTTFGSRQSSRPLRPKASSLTSLARQRRRTSSRFLKTSTRSRAGISSERWFCRVAPSSRPGKAQRLRLRAQARALPLSCRQVDTTSTDRRGRRNALIGKRHTHHERSDTDHSRGHQTSKTSNPHVPRWVAIFRSVPAVWCFSRKNLREHLDVGARHAAPT